MSQKRVDPQGWSTKVTRLGNGKYGCRVFKDGVLYNEGVAPSKSKIGATFKELLRWVDKLGYNSSMAAASRDRKKI